MAFLRSPDDLIRQAVAFRYNSLKAKVQVLTSRLSEVTSIVKIKNPSLLLQLQQSRVQMAAAAGAGIVPGSAAAAKGGR